MHEEMSGCHAKHGDSLLRVIPWVILFVGTFLSGVDKQMEISLNNRRLSECSQFFHENLPCKSSF